MEKVAHIRNSAKPSVNTEFWNAEGIQVYKRLAAIK